MQGGTPKFKSSEFKDALVQLKAIFDAHSMGIVLLDALERRAAEQIYGKATRGSGGRLSEMPKMDLVGQITGWFFSSDEVAYQVMKDMDRSCQKERHIVASIPEDQAPDRVGSYRAIAFKRERAKFVWALARDSRESVRKLANRIINEFFREVADLEKARAIVEGEEKPEGGAEDVELARRLQAQAERLSEATDRVTDLQSKLSSYEDERAKLLAAMGAKERALKQSSEAREELDHHLKALRSRLDELEAKQREVDLAKQSEREARAAAEELAQKVRRLEKLAGAASSLAAVQAELEGVKREKEEIGRQRAREEQAYQRERGELDRERGRLRADLEATREELRRARKRIGDLEADAERVKMAVVERFGVEQSHGIRFTGDGADGADGAPAAGEERVAILLDQANIAGIAHQAFGRKVNFSALIDQLVRGRKLSRAVAFVVDNGGTAFDAFCDTLRRSGWDLRIKKPKRFADGRAKADWDMGMAMEAIELREKAEVLVLVSGDGDFAPLVRRLQRWGQHVEVAAFPEGLAGELATVADQVVRLDRRALE